MSNRYRRLTDLFVQGKALPLPENAGYLWVQVINTYEREVCMSDAQVARARLILALKSDGDERTKVEGRLEEVGFKAMAEDLARAKAQAKVPDFADQLRDDPEWKERVDIVLKTDFSQAATVPEESETLLLMKINQEVAVELETRENDEYDFLMRKYNRMQDDEFIEEWVEYWVDQRGSAVAAQEYRLTEIWFSARYCDATEQDGVLDHSKCGGHRERVFEDKAEARSAPQALQDLIRDALVDLNLEGRDPKDSASPESSSGSQPTPNEAEESQPSTSEEIPELVPGI